MPEPKQPAITELFPMSIHDEVVEKPKQQEMAKWSMLEEIRDIEKEINYQPGTVIFSTFDKEPPDVWPPLERAEPPIMLMLVLIVVICAYLISRELKPRRVK